MKLIADLHIHTVSSGHSYSTLEEYVAQAKKIGLNIIGISDHGPKMPGGPHIYHFCNLKMVPRKLHGIKILRGIEANVINDKGEIDISKDDFEYGQMDYAAVAMHPKCGYENQGEEKNTEVIIKAIKNPLIRIIAHPGNPRYPIKVKEVVEAAEAYQVAIEINNSSPSSRPGSFNKCLEFAREAKRIGAKVIIGSDSHISTMLGGSKEAMVLVKQAGLRTEDILNTSEKMLREFLSL